MFTVRIAINVKVLLIIHFETIYQSYNNTSMRISRLLERTRGSYGVS